METKMTAGTRVSIIDNLNGYETVIGTGNIDRVTGSIIFVQPAKGKVLKFRTKNLRCVGYDWMNNALSIKVIE